MRQVKGYLNVGTLPDGTSRSLRTILMGAGSLSCGQDFAPLMRTMSLHALQGSHAQPRRQTVSVVNSPLQSVRKEHDMLKILGSTIGIIFLIGLAVVIGLLALIF